jgi:hypothetical protein
VEIRAQKRFKGVLPQTHLGPRLLHFVEIDSHAPIAAAVMATRSLWLMRLVWSPSWIR